MSAGDRLRDRRESAALGLDSPAVTDGPVATDDGERALADLARNHHEALVRFLTLRTGSREDAQEVAQEAYAKLLALDRRDTISFLAGYLWRIATNLAVDHQRRREVGDRFSARTGQATAAEASSESVVDARQRLLIVERALGELPPKCLQAFMLRVLSGLKFQQVGRQMGISDRMAKAYVARALEYLQDSLDAADWPRSRP
ncbi:MAG: sigma-70 family RNA polymerase sigma factor [Steroidobacteraceae bacterium]